MSYFNKFKSTNVGGGFLNSALGTDPAYAKLEGSLELGKQTETQVTDPQTGQTSTVYTNTGGEIIFKINGATFTLTREILSRLVNVSSDVQNQLDTKASTTYVNGQISLLDSEIETKANASDLLGYVSIANDVTINGAKTFSSLVSCSSVSQPSLTSHLTTKGFVDAAISSSQSSLQTSIDSKVSTTTYNAGIASLNSAIALKADDNVVAKLAGTNAFSGTNTFNTSLPTSTLTPSSNSQLTTKSYVDTADSTLLTNINTRALDADVVKLAGAQTISGVKTFSSLPISTVTPTLADQFCRKGYVDTQVATKANTSDAVLLAGAQTITGLKTFSGGAAFTTSLPTSTITPTLADEFCRKGYVDTQVATKANTSDVVLLTGAQTIAGTKTFSAVPKSSIGPTANEDLVRLVFANNNYGRLSSANIWSANNTFTGNILVNSLTITPTELSRLDGVTSNIQTQLDGKISTSTANTFTAKQTFNANIDVASEVVFTSSTLAGAVKGSASQSLVLTSMAGQDLYLNPDKGATTISSVNINTNHGAGRTNVYGHSMNLACPLAMGAYPILSDGYVSADKVTLADGVYGKNLYTDTLRANNNGNVECYHPLCYNGYFKTKGAVAAYMYDANTSGVGGLPYCIPAYSVARLRPVDNDDRWLIMPGFKLLLYDSDNYGGNILNSPVEDWENDTYEPICKASTSINAAASVKVYFRPKNSVGWGDPLSITGLS